MVTMTARALALVSVLYTSVFAANTKNTCETGPPVMSGTHASVTCHFNHDVSVSRSAFNVRLVTGSGDVSEDTVLDCHWGEAADPDCSTVKAGYEFDLSVSDSLTLNLPNVSLQQNGTYVCQAVPSEPWDLLECVLLVLPKPSHVTSGILTAAPTTQDASTSENTTSFSWSRSENINETSTVGTRNDSADVSGAHEAGDGASLGVAVAVPVVMTLLLAAAGAAVFCCWRRKKFCFQPPKQRSFIVHIRKDDTIDYRFRKPKEASENSHMLGEVVARDQPSYDLSDIDDGLSHTPSTDRLSKATGSRDDQESLNLRQGSSDHSGGSPLQPCPNPDIGEDSDHGFIEGELEQAQDGKDSKGLDLTDFGDSVIAALRELDNEHSSDWPGPDRMRSCREEPTTEL